MPLIFTFQLILNRILQVRPRRNDSTFTQTAIPQLLLKTIRITYPSLLSKLTMITSRYFFLQMQFYSRNLKTTHTRLCVLLLTAPHHSLGDCSHSHHDVWIRNASAQEIPWILGRSMSFCSACLCIPFRWKIFWRNANHGPKFLRKLDQL